MENTMNPPIDNIVGDIINKVIDNKYHIVEKIKDGSMGAVYRARDLNNNRDVAIKILRPEFANDEKLISRFETEATTLSNFSHTNIAKILDFGHVLKTFYIITEFIDGEDLSEIIKMRSPLPADRALLFASGVASGLAYAHGQGIIHRDIKPGNILVDKSGRVVITDFGIAKIVDVRRMDTTEPLIGTPEYMSLEQVEGLDLNGQTDIYSLGVVLYEMLTGKSPFRAESDAATLAKIINEDAVPLISHRSDLLAQVYDIVETAMAKNRDKRYASARKLVYDIGNVLSTIKRDEELISTPVSKRESTTTMPGQSKPTSIKQIERRPKIAFIFFVIFLILISFIYINLRDVSFDDDWLSILMPNKDTFTDSDSSDEDYKEDDWDGEDKSNDPKNIRAVIKT
jgi:eukaryotic-like serine/threonine-protein kinase